MFAPLAYTIVIALAISLLLSLTACQTPNAVESGTVKRNHVELLRIPYTGCNPRGLLLARDKSLSKKLLAYHRIGVPEFEVYRIGRPIRRPTEVRSGPAGWRGAWGCWPCWWARIWRWAW